MYTCVNTNNMKYKMIRVNYEVYSNLKKLKIYPNQSFNSVLKQLYTKKKRGKK
jgi:predicted CopG family antitoxin